MLRRSQDAREPKIIPKPSLWQKFVAVAHPEKASISQSPMSSQSEMSRLDRLRQVSTLPAPASSESLRRYKYLDRGAAKEMNPADRAVIETLFTETGAFLSSLSSPNSDVKRASAELVNYQRRFQALSAQGLNPEYRQRVAGMQDDLKGAAKYLASYLESPRDLKWATLLAQPEQINVIKFHLQRYTAFLAPKVDKSVSFNQAKWMLIHCNDLLKELQEILKQMATKPPSLMVDNKLAAGAELYKMAQQAKEHLQKQQALLEKRLAN